MKKLFAILCAVIVSGCAVVVHDKNLATNSEKTTYINVMRKLEGINVTTGNTSITVQKSSSEAADTISSTTALINAIKGV